MNTMILCTDNKNGIGVNNTIPWYSSADFRHFKESTVGKKILMGYNTWASLPEHAKPLPNRVNIVITNRQISDEYYMNHPSVIFIHESHLSTFMENNFDLMIIGGAKLFERTLRYTDRIIKSTIQGEYECDTFFDIHSSENDVFKIKSMKELEDGTIVEYFEREYRTILNAKGLIWI